MSESNQITGRQIAAGRVLLGMGQDELATAATISVPTLRRMEASAGPATGLPNNVRAVRSALEAAGVEFIAENGGGAGVRLKQAVPHLLRHSVSAFDGRVLFEVEYRGEKHMVRLPATVLEDIDRANYRSDQELSQSFDRHRSLVLLRAAAAIDAGRRGEGDQPLALAGDDFPEAS